MAKRSRSLTSLVLYVHDAGLKKVTNELAARRNHLGLLERNNRYRRGCRITLSSNLGGEMKRWKRVYWHLQDNWNLGDILWCFFVAAMLLALVVVYGSIGR